MMAGKELAHLQKEVARLRTRVGEIEASGAYRLGRILEESTRNPRALMALPGFVRDVLRRKSAAPPTERRALAPLPVGASIVFCPTNGVGFGHFTRCLAVARQIRRQRPEIPIVFLVSTPMVYISRAFGFQTYYVPPRSDLEVMGDGGAYWSSLLGTQLGAILPAHHAGVFVFDGVVPFQAIMETLAETPQVRRAWIRRGLLPADKDAMARKHVDSFQMILRPSEASARPEEAAADDRNRPVPPIVSVAEEDFVPRDEARRRLGLDPERLAVYVQLGAGIRNDTTSNTEIVLDVLRRRPEVQIVLAESPLSPPSRAPDASLVVIREYPNAHLFKAFDAAISAAGYNTFHELVLAGVPTVFVPLEPSSAGSDNQVARAEFAVEAGAAVLVHESLPAEDFERAIRSHVEALLDDGLRQRMRDAAGRLAGNLKGAGAAAAEILTLYDGAAGAA